MSSTSEYTKEQLAFFGDPKQHSKLAQHFTNAIESEDSQSNNPPKPTNNESVPPLFSTPPTEKEKKKGRVKYVTKENEKISYPLPPPTFQDKSMRTVALSFQAGNGNIAKVLYQDQPSNAIPSDVDSPFYNASVRLQ